LKKEQLTEIENRAIRDAVKKQEAIGLQGVTDGEFRRDWWHLDFLSQLEGVTLKALSGPKFGGTEEQPPIPTVTGKVAYRKKVMLDDFAFLKSVAAKTPKFTVPSPSMLHMRPGPRGNFARGVSRPRRILGPMPPPPTAPRSPRSRTRAAPTCSSTTPRSRTCAIRRCGEACRKNGDDPDKLPARYADTINRALEGRPAGMAVTMHTCRGNFKSTWVAEGGYESVAEAMFSANVDGFFMEFDSARAGSFEPLRYLPKGKKVVLGLITTKSSPLEEKDFIKRRIEEASKYVSAGEPVPVAAVRLLEHAPWQPAFRGRAVAQASSASSKPQRRYGDEQ